MRAPADSRPAPGPRTGHAPRSRLTEADYAAFGRWLAELLADAWRNGLRPSTSAARDAEGGTPPGGGGGQEEAPRPIA